MKVLRRLLPTVLMALILDGLSKWWVIQTLTLYQPVPVVGQLLQLTWVYNTGVAFSLFAQAGTWLVLITIFIGLMIAALAAWFFKAFRRAELPVGAAWPAGLILGGALANWADRLANGRVVDFIDAGVGQLRWPAFNLADSFIVVGIIWLLWLRMQAVQGAVEDVQTLDNSLGADTLE